MSEILDDDDPQWIDPVEDGMHPPTIPQLVECIHCGEEYDSWRIEWRVERSDDGRVDGMWVCPMPGCDGAGFGIDIHPVDYDADGNWADSDGREMHVSFTDEDEFDEDEEDWSDDLEPPAGGNGEVRDFDGSDCLNEDDIPF